MNPSNIDFIDFLKNNHIPTDYATRLNLARTAGINQYQGTAQQNSELLTFLQQRKTN